MYPRAKLRFRPFLRAISALVHRSQLQSVGNQIILRDWEEGDGINPLDIRRLRQLHNVIFRFPGFINIRLPPESCRELELVRRKSLGSSDHTSATTEK